VFGDVEAESAGEVLRNWDQIKAGEDGREPGIFGEVPENLPALLYARKLQRRAATADLLERAPDPDAASRDADFDAIGDRLFAVVDEARRLRVDPELALRAAAQRFRDRLASAQGDT
jgi:XTP/dITP diphosphohydrolase/tetrapyrrole methylase family protein/MazG family protein/ATP diphosphatase